MARWRKRTQLQFFASSAGSGDGGGGDEAVESGIGTAAAPNRCGECGNDAVVVIIDGARKRCAKRRSSAALPKSSVLHREGLINARDSPRTRVQHTTTHTRQNTTQRSADLPISSHLPRSFRLTGASRPQGASSQRGHRAVCPVLFLSFAHQRNVIF